MRRAKPALERGGSLDGSLPGPPPRDSEGAPPPPSEPPEDLFTSKPALERVDHIGEPSTSREPCSEGCWRRRPPDIPESLDRSVRPGSARAAALPAQACRGVSEWAVEALANSSGMFLPRSQECS